jgi:hypothetical protein
MRSIPGTVATAASFVISVLLALAGTGFIALSSFTLAVVQAVLAGSIAAAISAGSLSPVMVTSTDDQWR